MMNSEDNRIVLLTVRHGRGIIRDGGATLDGGTGMPTPRGFLTVTEAAARLGLSDSRVYKLVTAGRLETIRVGGKVLLLLEKDVKRFKRQPAGRPPPRRPRPSRAELSSPRRTPTA